MPSQINFNQYKRILEINRYAQKFWSNMSNDLFAGTFKDYKLPIIYNPDYIKKNTSESTSGVTSELTLTNGNKLSYVEISCDDRLSIIDMKSAVRHEAMHFALKIIGVKSDDNSAIFRIISEIYNGNFYGVLNSIEEKIYKLSFSAAEEAIKTASEYPNDLDLKVHILVLLEEIGNVKYQTEEDIPKLEAKISMFQIGLNKRKNELSNIK